MQNQISTDTEVRPTSMIDHVAKQLLLERWGLDCELSPCATELDRIYRVRSREGELYALRLCHSKVSHEEIDMQTGVASHLSEHLDGFAVPEPVPTLDGEVLLKIDKPAFGFSYACLSKWVSGVVLVKTVKSRSQAFNLGAAVGSMSLALKNYWHPSVHRRIVWDLRRADEVLELMPSIGRLDVEELAKNSLMDSDVIINRLYQTDFEEQVLHADVTPYNVLASSCDTSRISGFVDFGDATYGPRVFELAIAASYWVDVRQQPGAIDHVVELVRGYISLVPLSEHELQCLIPLIQRRMAMTAVITLEHAARVPENVVAITKNTDLAVETMRVLSGRKAAEWSEELINKVFMEQ